jgi:RNA exonuclease 1
VDHPSVGTNDEVIERNEKKEQLENLRLTTADIEALVLSKEKLVSWGYMVEIPDGPGGERLSETGNSMRCERCGERFQVIPDVDNKDCSYHWGKKLSVRANGQSIPHDLFSEELITAAASRWKNSYLLMLFA